MSLVYGRFCGAFPDPELQSFALATIDSIKDRLTRFDVNRHMALMTDWSKTGVGSI